MRGLSAQCRSALSHASQSFGRVHASTRSSGEPQSMGHRSRRQPRNGHDGYALFLGIFTQPLRGAFRWDLTVTTWTDAIANFSLGAIGVLIGGFWQDRVGPWTVTIVGVTLWGAGNVLAGVGTPALGAPWLYLTHGVIGGVGAPEWRTSRPSPWSPNGSVTREGSQAASSAGADSERCRRSTPSTSARNSWA